MDLGYDQFGTRFDDDSRGFRKKKGPMAKVMRFSSKGSWVLVLLLLGFVWHLHSHKKTLHNELESHKDEKQGLMEQLGHLDSSVAQKTKEAEEYQRLHSQVSNLASQHQSNLQKTQEDLANVQDLYEECKHNLEDERARAAARKCEDCNPLRTQITAEQAKNTQWQAEINHLKTQLNAVTAQLEHYKQQPIPKPVDTTTQQAAGAGGGAATQQQQHTTHDDHIDAAIAGHQQAVPIPVANQQQQQQQQQQQHQQEQQVPVQQEGQRRWGRGSKVPIAADENVHHDEHIEPVMTPDERRLKRRSGGRRKGGLSMLEEHLGVEHDEVAAEDIHY